MEKATVVLARGTVEVQAHGVVLDVNLGSEPVLDNQLRLVRHKMVNRRPRFVVFFFPLGVK